MTSETHPPCARCRHAETCTLPPTCHALRQFRKTGLPTTPPRRNPCASREVRKPSPRSGLKPRIVKRKDEFANARLAELAAYYRRKREEMSQA
jgi:hypothetical protein